MVICSQTSGTDLGLKNTGFSVDYRATDPDGDGVTVTEAIDREKQRVFHALPDETYTFTVSGETFMTVLNGGHALTITTSDGKADTVHSLLFRKKITSALITLVDAVPADARIAVCVLSVSGSIPADAHFKVEVTNNGLDDEPVWEDCTNEVRTEKNTSSPTRRRLTAGLSISKSRPAEAPAAREATSILYREVFSNVYD